MTVEEVARFVREIPAIRSRLAAGEWADTEEATVLLDALTALLALVERAEKVLAVAVRDFDEIYGGESAMVPSKEEAEWWYYSKPLLADLRSVVGRE